MGPDGNFEKAARASLMCSQAWEHGPLWGSTCYLFSSPFSPLPPPLAQSRKPMNRLNSLSWSKPPSPLEVPPSFSSPIYSHFQKGLSTPLISTFYACVLLSINLENHVAPHTFLSGYLTQAILSHPALFWSTKQALLWVPSCSFSLCKMTSDACSCYSGSTQGLWMAVPLNCGDSSSLCPTCLLCSI